VEFEDRQEYEVKYIFNHDKDTEGVLYFRVKWAGFNDPKDNTWELAEYLSSTRAKVKEYWQGQKKAH